MNFVAVTTTSTTPVVIAPTVLITIEVCQPFCASAPLCRSASQWRIIPVCESVNDVNTPTTYIWISLLRFASNATITRIEPSASPITPFEKTSRSPRFMNWRGM